MERCCKRPKMHSSTPGVASILSSANPDPDYDAAIARESLDTLKLLVIGAGGLGCEILKTLSLLGFKKIHVVDMDTIDLTNLNRQFLFREGDVGKSKAQIAAQKVMDRVPGVEIVAHCCRIQDLDDDFYRQFGIVLCGLDSVEARRWINAKILSLLDDSPESLRPIIDGGTEGMQGQSRVILPGMTACYECTLDMVPKQQAYPLCTIASNPRLPEHCVEWASVVAWPKHFDRPADNDDPVDVQWIYEKALEWAKQHSIRGITLELTQGVIKRIIPAISATNALIASECCNEAFKLATSCAGILNGTMSYSGVIGEYTNTYELEKKEDCLVCGAPVETVDVLSTSPLQSVIDLLRTKFELISPSLSLEGKALYVSHPKQLELELRPNLKVPVASLFPSGDEIGVSDRKLPNGLKLIVTYN